MSELSGFLTGIRILDLAHYIPGPMTTLFLRDMGASVIKIEPPQGDGMKLLGPRDTMGRPTFYHALNAGKSLMTLNLKDDADREVFLRLVADADVVVEGFRPGVLERLGIAYPALKAANPRIILCSISGYGAANERSDEAGHDANYLALSGVMHRNGAQTPTFYDPPFSDVTGALFAGMAILGALSRRDRTGLGCEIEIGLADTIMPLQLMQIADLGESGRVPVPEGGYLNGGAAYYNVYRTADERHIVVGAIEPKFWRNFCLAAERPEWIDRHHDPLPQHALKADISDMFAALTLADVLARFDQGDHCVSEVRDLNAALSDARVRRRALVRRGAEGDLQALFPALIDGEAPASRPAGPIPIQPGQVASIRHPSSPLEHGRFGRKGVNVA